MAHWNWYRWTQTVDPNQESAWRASFFNEPNLHEKLAVAVARAGPTTPRQTYWVVTGRAARTNESLSCWARLFVAEAAHDPELLRLRLHALRWQPPASRPIDGPAAPGFLARCDATLAQATEADLVWPALQAVLPLVEACGLTGRHDLIRGVNESNWRERYRQWHDWHEPRAAYLRWDKSAGHLSLDEAAFRERRPLPLELRRIPPADAPLPGWAGPDPEL